MNLMDERYPFIENFDIIFFRNAMIYFDKENQEKILGRLAGHMNKGGFLIIGHSETMSGYDLPLRSVASTIYRRV
jgi:chemotaxis protein methyltransferase CheR